MVALPPWRRRNLVHYSPIGRVTQMCSVFLSGLLGVWDWMDLVSLCKIPQGIFPLGNRTSVGSCGCGVYGYTFPTILDASWTDGFLRPGCCSFAWKTIQPSAVAPGGLRGFRGCWVGRPEPARGREVFHAIRGLNRVS